VKEKEHDDNHEDDFELGFLLLVDIQVGDDELDPAELENLQVRAKAESVGDVLDCEPATSIEAEDKVEEWEIRHDVNDEVSLQVLQED